MQISAILGLLAATAVATPVALPRGNGATPFQPANGTVAKCSTDQDWKISLVVGPEDATSIPKDACAGIMQPCAFPDRVSNKTVCMQPTTFALKACSSARVNATVEYQFNKQSDKDAEFTVCPAEQPAGSAPVMWTAKDCIGYFSQLLTKPQPAGCGSSAEAQPGVLTVGGAGSFKGAVFNITIVDRK